MTSETYSTIAQSLWPISSRPLLRSAVLAVSGTLVLTVSAKIQIPFYPVPQTLQTMVVLLIGMVFGTKLGAMTIMLYYVEGAMGIPVFAGTPEKGIGLAYMLGPTGGYLAGFLLAAMACGELARRGWDRQLWLAGMAMVIGNILIYVCGLLWLGSVVGWDKPVLEWGLYPFVFGDLVKIVFIAVTLPLLSKAMRR